MTDFFLSILNMSLSASWLVLAVIVLRVLLKKAPKWISVLLWGLVAFRLVCPFTLESALSLIPSAEVVSPEIMLDPSPSIHTGIDAVNRVVNPVIQESFTADPVASANPLQIWIPIFAVVWILGIAVMAAYMVFSYWRLRHRVKMAIRVKHNVYLSEYVESPFVLGLFKPRIYLPYHMSELDRFHVLAHERAHIRRRDHWWKPLGFLLLTVHWFNPLMWAAYILLCRDIELACDEKVIKELGAQQRADYSQALLNCSAHRSLIAACPVAFGEVGVQARVKNVLCYKKPAFWIIVIAVIACLVVAVCFLTNPKLTLPFMEEYIPVNTALAMNNADRDNIGLLELNKYEREELGYRLRDICGIKEYTGEDPEYISNQFYLRAELETEDTVFLYVLSWDDDPVLLKYQEQLYQVNDEEFTEYLQAVCSRSYIVPAQGDDCGITIEAAEASSTGMTIYVREPEYPEDTYVIDNGNYRLQRKVNGLWTDVEPLPGSEGCRINSTIFISEEGHPQKLSWGTLYGELAAGSYRLLNDYILISDDSPVRYTVYAEFSISAEGQGSSTMTANAAPAALEDLPAGYSLEQATIDKCVIMVDGDIRDNQEVWEDFISKESDGNPATVRCVRYTHSDGTSGSSMFIYDILYDGSAYILRGLLDGNVFERTFQYLRDTTGLYSGSQDSFDAYLCYYFADTSIDSLILCDIATNGSITSDQTAFVVYSDLIYYPDKLEIPEPSKAELVDNGSVYLTITDPTALQNLYALLSNAEWLGYYPKTPNFGPNLRLYGASGEMVDAQLDLASDLIEVDGQCFDYGPGYDGFGSNNDIFRLWQILGLTDWTVPNLSKWPDGINQRYFSSEMLHDTLMNRMFSCMSFTAGEDSFSLKLANGETAPVSQADQDTIWAYLCYTPLEKAYNGGPDTAQAEYVITIHDTGWNMDCMIYYLGDHHFCIKRTIDDHIYTCTDTDLAEIIEAALS